MDANTKDLMELFNNASFRVGDKVNRNILVNCDHGLMIINRFDSNSNGVGHGQWLMDHGNVSTIETHNCYEAIKHIESPIIFDIGANIGTFTTWMAKAFPNGKIYSFEPQRPVFQILCGNMAINNIYNAFVYNYGIGANDECFEIEEPNYFQKTDYGRFSLRTDTYVERTKDKLVIEIKKLDSFIETYKVSKVDLIKIDVEGMDMDVLRGSVNCIKMHRPKIFIEYTNDVDSIKDEIIEFLMHYHYKFDVIGNNILCY